jgi:hypothetical protein
MVTRAKMRVYEMARFSFKINMARPTGIEPESPKNSDTAEEPNVIDISKLKKAES